MDVPEVAHRPRALLGPADVGDEQFSAMVAENLGVGRAEVLGCEVSVAEYDLEALTTAGRFWVRGTARHDGGTAPFAFFVKVVQSWTRSPAFAHVPPHLHEVAAAGLPWRNEPRVYRSDLAERLPPGFSMPAAHAVIDLDDASAALWLPGIDVDTAPWQITTFERAARGLGRFAGSVAVAPTARAGSARRRAQLRARPSGAPGPACVARSPAVGAPADHGRLRSAAPSPHHRVCGRSPGAG